MIPVIVLHQLFNQPFMNRDILYTEKNIVPAGHTRHNRQQFRLEYLFLIPTFLCFLPGILCIHFGLLQFALIHQARSL